MTRAQALALGSPSIIVLTGCLVWAVADWTWQRLKVRA